MMSIIDSIFILYARSFVTVTVLGEMTSSTRTVFRSLTFLTLDVYNYCQDSFSCMLYTGTVLMLSVVRFIS